MPNRLMNLDGSKPIMENWDDLNVGFDNTEAELDAAAAVSEGIQAEVTQHKDSTAAHASEHITYTGAVVGADNIKQAVEFVDGRVSTIIAGGGEGKDPELTDIQTPDPGYTPGREIVVAGDMVRDMQHQFSAQLAETGDQLSSQWVNALFPPAPLLPIISGGVVDAAPAIQAAINYASTFSPAKRVFIPSGVYKIAGLVTITCDFESQGEFNIHNGGKFVVTGSGRKIYRFVASVIDIDIDYDIFRMQASNSDIYEISISYDGPPTNIPLYTAINFEPEAFPEGVWDVTIHDAYISNANIGIQLKSVGYITDITIKDSIIRGYYSYGILMDNSNYNPSIGNNIVYCSFKGINFQNNRLSNNTKTCIHLDGLGLLVDDIKIFNDQPTLGIHYAITASDTLLDELVSDLDTINLAAHCTMNTSNKISNVRAEGIIDLGKMRNLYKLDNVHVYQALNTTHYDDYNFHYDYEPDYSDYEVDLANVTVETATPADIIVVKEDKNLRVTMNATTNFRVLMDLPQYIIDAANTSGYLVLAMSTDLRTKNAVSSFVNFAMAPDNLTIIHPVNQSTNLRQDGKIVALYNPLSGTSVPGTALVYLNVDGTAGDTYKINCVRVYTELVNPIKDLTPYLKNV